MFPVDTLVRKLGKDWQLCSFVQPLSKPKHLTVALCNSNYAIQFHTLGTPFPCNLKKPSNYHSRLFEYQTENTDR